MESSASISDPCYDGNMRTYALNYRIENEGIWDKKLEYNSREWYPRDIHIENETSKVRFLTKYDHF